MFLGIARRAVAALAATVLIGLTASNAASRSLSASNQNLRVTFTSLEIASEIVTIRCNATLEGSFHSRTIAKVAGSLIGAITRARTGHPCTNGEAWFDNGTEAAVLGTLPSRLPFHLTYEGFTGTLPNITSVRLLFGRLSFAIDAVFCIGRYGRASDNVSLSASRDVSGGITTLAPVAGRNFVALAQELGGLPLCPASATLLGSGTVTALNSSARITVTLI